MLLGLGTKAMGNTMPTTDFIFLPHPKIPESLPEAHVLEKCKCALCKPVGPDPATTAVAVLSTKKIGVWNVKMRFESLLACFASATQK